MKITVKNQEVLEYLDFLYKKGELHKVLPELEVPERLLLPYLDFKQKNIFQEDYEETYEEPFQVICKKEQEEEQLSTTDSNTTSKGRNFGGFENAMNAWTESEHIRLKHFVKQNTCINYMSKALGRSPQALKQKARNNLSYKYLNGSWIYKGK